MLNREYITLVFVYQGWACNPNQIQISEPDLLAQKSILDVFECYLMTLGAIDNKVFRHIIPLKISKLYLYNLKYFQLITCEKWDL